jgi:hypothetical protein
MLESDERTEPRGSRDRESAATPIDDGSGEKPQKPQTEDPSSDHIDRH